jgi:hypothetical protein
MKMQGLNNNFIYKPYCKQKETNQAGYQEGITQPKMQGQPMKKMMRKKNRPKIQPKKGFLSLCRHLTVMTETQEDSTTIKLTQQTPNSTIKQRRMMYVTV